MRGGGLGADRSGSTLWLGHHPSPLKVGSAGCLYSTSLPEGTSPDSQEHPQAERTPLHCVPPLHPGTRLCSRVRGTQSRSRGRQSSEGQSGCRKNVSFPYLLFTFAERLCVLDAPPRRLFPKNSLFPAKIRHKPREKIPASALTDGGRSAIII